MDKAELLELIRSLTPRELRVLMYTHKCTDSTSLVTCCEVSRCHACHIQHMAHDHTAAEVFAYQKFASAGNLTWRAKEYKQPLKENKKRESKPRAVSSKVSVRVEDLSDAQLDRLVKLLVERSTE